MAYERTTPYNTSGTDDDDYKPFDVGGAFGGLSDAVKYNKASPAERQLYDETGMFSEEYKEQIPLQKYRQFQKNPFGKPSAQYEKLKEEGDIVRDMATAQLRDQLGKAALTGTIDEKDLSGIFTKAMGVAGETTAKSTGQLAQLQSEDTLRRGQIAEAGFLGLPPPGKPLLQEVGEQGLKNLVGVAMPLLLADSLLNTKPPALDAPDLDVPVSLPSTSSGLDFSAYGQGAPFNIELMDGE
tara:strand:- start:718 stop:1437 length:720 start_codon:yes stop_codon:yes gene_type:complete